MQVKKMPGLPLSYPAGLTNKKKKAINAVDLKMVICILLSKTKLCVKL